MPCLLRLWTPWGVVAISERYRGESQTFSALFQPQWNTAQPTTSFHPGRTDSPSSLLQDHRFPKNVSLQTQTSKRWVTFYFILIDLSRTWDFQRGKGGRKNPTGLSGDSYSHSKGNCSSFSQGLQRSQCTDAQFLPGPSLLIFSKLPCLLAFSNRIARLHIQLDQEQGLHSVFWALGGMLSTQDVGV